jgi:hypothetical protein
VHREEIISNLWLWITFCRWNLFFYLVIPPKYFIISTSPFYMEKKLLLKIKWGLGKVVYICNPALGR